MNLLLKKYIKIYFLFIISCFFFFVPFFCFASQNKNPPAVPYMDQVIKRKKKVIIEKCLKHIKVNTKGFMMIEIKVSPKGITKARLVATELEAPKFVNCTLSVLNRIQFKKIKNSPVTRIYRFFVL